MGDSRNPAAPVQWYAPDPRCIFPLDDFHIPKRLLRTYRQGKFEYKINGSWHEVLAYCAARQDTWITDEIFDAYTELQKMGRAHSVEAYCDGELAGGLYGVSIGGAFMGESMFHLVTDASKCALVFLVERMKERGFVLLDCQFMTGHLSKFGAVDVPQAEYMQRLQAALKLNPKLD